MELFGLKVGLTEQRERIGRGLRFVSQYLRILFGICGLQRHVRTEIDIAPGRLAEAAGLETIESAEGTIVGAEVAGDGTLIVFEESGRSAMDGGGGIVMAHGRVAGLETFVEVFVMDEHVGIHSGGDHVFHARGLPFGDDEVLDEVLLGLANGLELIRVDAEEGVEGFLGFVGEDDTGGIHSVLCGVLGRACAAGLRGGSARQLAIAAAGSFLSFGTWCFFHK